MADIVDTAVGAGSFKTLVAAVQAADLVATLKARAATTVQGKSVSIDTTNGVHVDGATVTQADIVADNGVIHVIDAVLLPR